MKKRFRRLRLMKADGRCRVTDEFNLKTGQSNFDCFLIAVVQNV